jgi:hypothetical protein
VPRYDQFILPFGLGIAVAALLYWSAWELDRYGMWLGEGVIRAAVALGAVGVFSLVLRVAHGMAERVTEHHGRDHFDEP